MIVSASKVSTKSFSRDINIKLFGIVSVIQESRRALMSFSRLMARSAEQLEIGIDTRSIVPTNLKRLLTYYPAVSEVQKYYLNWNYFNYISDDWLLLHSTEYMEDKHILVSVKCNFNFNEFSPVVKDSNSKAKNKQWETHQVQRWGHESCMIDYEVSKYWGTRDE